VNTTASPDITVESHRSSHREALLEHLFAGEVMKCLWLKGEWRLEILKPQVDDGGYDLVLEANEVIRHVQLKTSFHGSKVRIWNVNTLLSGKPSGCVICVRFDRSTLQFTEFYFLRRSAWSKTSEPGDNNRSAHQRQFHGSEDGACEDSRPEVVALSTCRDHVGAC
jgi:hypothetical protein